MSRSEALFRLFGGPRIIRVCRVCEEPKKFRRGDDGECCASCKVTLRLCRPAIEERIAVLREAHAAVYGGRVAR